ncbi:MAG: T9SS type A sorting domain-containing protein [Saprospiraceae bacterium]|nr:T9SS type A sorting domain-containing protein [Saprospiraceae bacterium]
MRTFRLLSRIIIFGYFFSIATAFTPLEKCENSGKDKTSVACSITNFVVTPASNQCDGELLTLNFTFTGVDFGLNGYTITAVNANGGTFQLGDPQTLSVIALCEPDVTFTIFDNDNPNCSASFNYGQICCDCQYTIDITQSSCIGNSFIAIIDYQYTSGSCTNHYPYLTVNGEQIGFEYNSATGLYNSDNIGVTTPYVTYVFNTGVPGLNETYTEVLPNPCYTNIQFFDVSIDTLNCNNGIMEIPFTINEGFGLDGFIISDNFGNSQYYFPNDPHIYSIIADCFTTVSLTITDANDPLNTTTTTIAPICCPCQYELDLQISPCSAGAVDISFNFNSLSGSCIYYDWTITVNNDTLALDNYNGTYYTNGYHSNDSLLYITICALVPNQDECIRDTIANPCYIPNTVDPCSITNFSVTPDTTSCNGEVISLNFNFTGINFGTNGYTVSTNIGISQTFNLTDSTVLVSLADCNENIIVTITDVLDSLCTAIDTIGSLCCPCSADVNITQSNCIDGIFNASISINNQQGSCINNDWTLFINGQNYSLNPTNTGYNITVTNDTDSLLIYELCNILPNYSYCTQDTLVNPCYTHSNTSQCAITNFSVTPDTTACSGEIISLNFSVTGTNFGANGYTVTTNNGFSQMFSSLDTTLLVILADCNENIIVTITDANAPQCAASDTIGLVCCPCEADINLSQSDCNNATFNATFTFQEINGSCINYDWTLSLNGQNLPLTNTNTGYVATNISNADSLLIYQLCNLVPGLSECITYSVSNPCFVGTVGTKDVDSKDWITVSKENVHQILIQNKSDNNLTLNIFSINGSLLDHLQSMPPSSSKSIDISNWPSGIYIIKANSNERTATIKLAHFRK